MYGLKRKSQEVLRTHIHFKTLLQLYGIVKICSNLDTTIEKGSIQIPTENLIETCSQ